MLQFRLGDSLGMTWLRQMKGDFQCAPSQLSQASKFPEETFYHPAILHVCDIFTFQQEKHKFLSPVSS